MTSFTLEQRTAIYAHLEQAEKMLSELPPIAPGKVTDTLDYSNSEAVGRHVSDLRGAIAKLDRHIFQTYGIIHKFCQANWPKTRDPDPQPAFTVHDL